MIKKALLVLLAVLLVATAGCKRKVKETTMTSAMEETEMTQEVTIPGVEDSIFDDDFVQQEPEYVPETSAPTVDETLPPPGVMDYETFRNMQPARQRAYQESFESIEAFYEWYTAAQEAYDREHVPIEVGDGVIDMSEILGN